MPRAFILLCRRVRLCRLAFLALFLPLSWAVGSFAQHVANPFSGATQYLNPDYTKEVQAVAAQTSDSTLKSQMNVVTTYPTAVWLDKIAAITGNSAGGDRLGLTEHLDAALTQQQGTQPIVVTLVIYDLPDRDCAALASNGELSIAANPPSQPLSGIDTYKTNYIDPITAILSNSKYSNLRVVAVIEPDSLPNLVTNTGRSFTIQNCVDAQTSGVYVQGVQYAINKLHALPNVYLYLDIGHSGWLGWSTNMSPAVTLYTQLVGATTAGLNSIDGFISNTANYTPTKEPYMTATETISGQQVMSSNFYQYNPNIDEADFDAALYQAFVSAGFPSTIGFLIDTSRNGWGGAARPTGASTSTDLNTFVDATRIDRRNSRGQWCNQNGAGLGQPPAASPSGFFPQLQAFVWIKPPGESDGTYAESSQWVSGENSDENCNPTHVNALANNTVTNALPNSPVAGSFFPAEFTMLIQNSYPVVPTSQGATCSTVPSAPAGLTATAASSSSISLSWTAVTPPSNCSISSYSVYRSTVSGFTPSASNLVAAVSGATYSDTALSASTTYYYKIVAVDGAGSSTASTQASATTKAGGGGSACHITYSITNQWTGGFQAAITIGNTGSSALSSWTLTWSFANGQTITQLWNGTATQSGANVTVNSLGYNGSIPAGGSYTGVGFTGTWNTANSIPTSFAVNGATCN